MVNYQSSRKQVKCSIESNVRLLKRKLNHNRFARYETVVPNVTKKYLDTTILNAWVLIPNCQLKTAGIIV